jgi:hypothetical protein
MPDEDQTNPPSRRGPKAPLFRSFSDRLLLSTAVPATVVTAAAAIASFVTSVTAPLGATAEVTPFGLSPAPPTLLYCLDCPRRLRCRYDRHCCRGLHRCRPCRQHRCDRGSLHRSCRRSGSHRHCRHPCHCPGCQGRDVTAATHSTTASGRATSTYGAAPADIAASGRAATTADIAARVATGVTTVSCVPASTTLAATGRAATRLTT